MDGQVSRCYCSSWSPIHKAHRCAASPGQKKKKSRKHQRFSTRRDLEQWRHLRARSREKTLLVSSSAYTSGASQGTLLWEAGQNGPLSREDIAKVDSVTPPPPVDSPPSSGSAKQPSPSRDLKVPSPSAKDVGSSSCPKLKKPKKCVAIDCEMVGTGPGGKTSELARCTVVSYDGDVIYDKYIHPELPVVDYRTPWSGITHRHMENATPFKVAQGEILQILRDKIVVGHALHNDFRALKYFHPGAWVRDTSRCPLLLRKMGPSAKNGVSLKNLASQLLSKTIQVSKKGHSSVEDAQTSMELYRLVDIEWEQGLASSFSSNLPDSGTDSDCYMDDQYWPEDLDVDCK
ncbi:apoptosis-enhancing nuclease [Anolis carolinensis]|uniref:apoptosis-enhancing nuclease n=1 Tax=Anolis carolinensis TaxID=28377 RepID=UPI00046254FB|nr:PREDICTED: apoptosis-enhancing nuclease-like [Anolis carolinensis]|eukprot:XP_016853965.1 PREDICTED: apoptosis-enhancing nuclease-like [Anolis carolinensis]